MWRDWRPDVVDADLNQLADAGLQVLRVFPLWPDFQPITQLYTGAGRPMEMRHGEAPLPTTKRVAQASPPRRWRASPRSPTWPRSTASS